MTLACLLLRIPKIIVLLGAGGVGKSESIKLVYRKYFKWLCIVAPTGILAGTYNANTYFTTLRISKWQGSLSEDWKLKLNDKFSETRMLVGDEIFTYPIHDISTLFNRFEEVIDRYRYQTPLVLIGDHGQTLPKSGFSIMKPDKYGKTNEHLNKIYNKVVSP